VHRFGYAAPVEDLDFLQPAEALHIKFARSPVSLVDAVVNQLTETPKLMLATTARIHRWQNWGYLRADLGPSGLAKKRSASDAASLPISRRLK
jgi:hypothetical protein